MMDPTMPTSIYSRRVSGSASPAHDGDLVTEPLYTADQMRAYAAQAVAAEREACALVCGYRHDAKTIRARGKV